MEPPNHARLAEPTVKILLARSPHPPRTVEGGTGLASALEQLAGHGCQALLVVGPEGPIGSFSAADYARAANRHPADPGRLEVRDAMSPPPPIVTPAHTVRHCLALLETHDLHAVAVVEEGRVTGHIPHRDLLKAALDHADRVFYEIGVDQRVLFARGLYSC